MGLLVWMTGNSEWRGLITAIWYECSYIEGGVRLYEGVDGVISGRYGVRKEEFTGRHWVPEIIDKESVAVGGVGLVDNGVRGEVELRQWAIERKGIMESIEGVKNIVLHWGDGDNMPKIREWFRGDLGIFNERAFESNGYYEQILELRKNYWDRGGTWLETMGNYGGLKRVMLKCAEEHIANNLAKLVWMSER